MSAPSNTENEKSVSAVDRSQFNELKQMIALLDKRIQGTDGHVQVGFKETKRDMALMHGKVSALHEGSARKEMAGRHGKMFARPLLINHSYSLVKHFVESGVVKADTVEDILSHERIIIQACLPQTEPFKYVNLLVERVQQYVKDSPHLFLNTTFRDKGIMGPPSGKATNHYSFFRNDMRANPIALKILGDWIRNYNAVLRYLSLDALVVEGVVNSEGLRTALLALRKDGLASEEEVGIEKLSKADRIARNQLQGRQGASNPSVGTPAAMWKKIEEVLKSEKNEFLVDFNVALNEKPVAVNDDDSSVDVASLLGFLGLVTQRLKPLTDGVMAKSRVLGTFLHECEKSLKADTSNVDSSHNAQTNEEAGKAELEKLSKAASAMLATPEFGPVFIMVLTCAAQHDAALLRLGDGMDVEEQVKCLLPKDLPPQELEIDLGGKITYRDGRLHVSAGEVKSGEKGVKQQAKAQLRIRTLVLGYAAKCLLVAKGQLVHAVEREGVIVTRKKTRTAGEADSDSDAASNTEETEQDRNDGIIFSMEHL